MTKYKIILVIIISFFIASCSSSNKEIKKVKFTTGEFNYKITDSSLSILASGIIKADKFKNNEISGNYSAEKDETIPFEGQETLKDGPFTGNFNDSLSIVFLNMNPRIADANIFISAVYYKDSLNGTWSYSTFRGIKGGGYFFANRIK